MKKTITGDSIQLIGFYAKNNLKLCEKFTEGHIDVLKQHGFLHFKSYDSYWYKLKESYVIIALYNDVPVGGIRLEHKQPNKMLPFEKVLYSNYPGVTKLHSKLKLTRLAEPCSLWNSKKVSGKNLSIFLSRASIALAPLLKIQNIISFNATYTFRIPQDVGCTLIKSVGENGYFNYPTKQFRAALWHHADLDNLAYADATARERMMSLRANPKQEYIEKYENTQILIKYDLEI